MPASILHILWFRQDTLIIHYLYWRTLKSFVQHPTRQYGSVSLKCINVTVKPASVYPAVSSLMMVKTAPALLGSLFYIVNFFTAMIKTALSQTRHKVTGVLRGMCDERAKDGERRS